MKRVVKVQDRLVHALQTEVDITNRSMEVVQVRYSGGRADQEAYSSTLRTRRVHVTLTARL